MTIKLNYDIVKKLIASRTSISTMESCTGGLLASTITDCSEASTILSGAFITYSNEAKIKNGVPANIIEKYGVYSLETADAMAYACANAYNAKVGVGITGSLGRIDPNNSDSIVGQVFFSIYSDGSYHNKKIELPDYLETRSSMKIYIVNEVLSLLNELLKLN